MPLFQLLFYNKIDTQRIENPSEESSYYCSFIPSSMRFITLELFVISGFGDGQ